jgi:radical SAM superfamily enzyme YgiQ (UPF0313 family)
MKTILLAINAKYIHSSLSVWLLARTIPHSIVIEANINQTDEHIAQQVMAHSPDEVLVSTYIWNAKKIPNIIRLVREKLHNIRFVLGGPQAVHNADYWLRNGADYVSTSQVQLGSVDPYTTEYLETLKGKLAYIETSRGCPFSCAFCLSGEGSSVDFLPLEKVKEQILKLAYSECRVVKFVDRTFNCSIKRAYEIFEYIINLESEKCFHFEVAADLFDTQTLELLSTAKKGIIQFEIGLQSFYEPTLKAVSRKTDLSKAVSNIKTLMSYENIHIHVDLIAGLPYEALPDFIDSFNQAYELNAHHLQLGFLKLLHGSRIRKDFPEIIHTLEPPYEVVSSPWLSEADLSLIKRTEHALQHTYNKGKYLSTLQYVLSVSELTAFELYSQLSPTAELIYDFCKQLHGVSSGVLLECMICDCLCVNKGVNMPGFMRIYDKEKHKERYIKIKEIAQERLGRRVARNEVAVLPENCGVFVDSQSRDRVTGLYKINKVTDLIF